MQDVTDKFIFKIVPARVWQAAQATGVVAPMPIDESDGYIHLSTRSQLPGTLALHFAGHENLAVLKVDISRLTQPLKWETARGGTQFPHLYGTLKAAAVVENFAVSVAPDGRCDLPANVD